MKKYPSFAGVHTALVTPFRNGRFDESSFIKLIEQQVAAGIHGIVPVGTTGESPTLTHSEQLRVIEVAIKTAAKKILVIAGTGSNSTAKTIETTQEAEKLGADAALVVVPYYNKPSPEGRYQHFKAVAEAVAIPIIPYDPPGRCGIELSSSVIARLATDCPNVVGLKDCCASVEHIRELKALLPHDFQILSGDDIWTLPFLKIGSVGVISVASNLIPGEIVKLVSLFQSGKLKEAEELHNRLSPLFRDLFIECNPVPVKTAMSIRGMVAEEFRLPLVSLTREHRATLLNTLQSLSL
ncbi:MAG: 4-hydroxy-tetrahydrodipicolinate synthase [Chthoniobacterales bacterium]|nr:4-hydroxy-tetrahydrodipicolinate synthase [Chthoniobacterales bacterium]